MNYRGRISRIVDGEIYVQISALAVDQDFGPAEVVSGSNFSEGDYVLVAQIDGAAEDVSIVGKLVESLTAIDPSIVLPATANSFFVGQADGSWAWKTTAQAKTILGVDTNTTTIAAHTTAITALQSEVQPVNRGGTGKTSWTAGNYVKAIGITTLSDVTSTTVKTDLGLDQVNNTSDANKPISTATQTALDLKTNIALVELTSEDLNSLTTNGRYIQSQNIEALSSLNYPVTYAGLLEVFGVASPVSMVWQRYSVYSNASSFANTKWERGLYNGIWGDWTYVGAGVRPHAFVYKTAVTNDYPTTLTQIDLTGNRTLRGGMTNTGGYVVTPLDGLYDIKFWCHVQSTQTTGAKTFSLRYGSGATIISSYSSKFDGINESDQMAVTHYLAAGSTISAHLDHSGAATGVTVYGAATAFYTAMTVTYQGS